MFVSRGFLKWGVIGTAVLVVLVLVFGPWGRGAAEERRVHTAKAAKRVEAAPASGEAKAAPAPAADGKLTTATEVTPQATKARAATAKAVLAAFREEVGRAEATDGAVDALAYGLLVGAEERRLRKRVVDADLEHCIDDFFESAGPNADFYAEDWMKLRRVGRGRETRTTVLAWMREVADGPDEDVPAAALKNMVRTATRKLEDAREDNLYLADRLRVITNLVKNHRQHAAVQPAAHRQGPHGDEPNSLRRSEDLFEIAHREGGAETPPVAAQAPPAARAPSWSVAQQRLLDKYRR